MSGLNSNNIKAINHEYKPTIDTQRSSQSILLSFVVIIALFFHFFRLGLIEFTGEDEALVMIKIVRLLHWQTDMGNLGALFTVAHPPMRYLMSLPFIAFGGATEFWLRFGHALAGVLSVYWIFRIGRLVFDFWAGLIAALVLAVSSMSAVYRSANGIGLFTLFLLIALEFTLRYYHSISEEQAAWYLRYVSLSLGLACLTFIEGVMFALPVALLAVYHTSCRKILIKPGTIFLVLVGGYFLIWNVLPAIAVQLQLLPPVAGGNPAHVWDRLSNLGAFNVVEWVGAILGTNSLAIVLLLLIAIIFEWRYLWAWAWFPTLYFTPHALVWIFGLKNPCGHGAYITPLLALLIGGGLWKLWQSTPTAVRLVRHRVILIALIMICILFAAWHNYVLNLQGELDPLGENLVYFDRSFMNVPCGAPQYNFLGQSAAGLFVREHSQPMDRVLSDFGGSMELYYAGTPHATKQFTELDASLNDSSLMKALGIHYLILQAPDGYDLAQLRPPAAIVLVANREALYVFDLWNNPTSTTYLQAERERAKFYQRYANWRNIRPASAVLNR